MAERALLLLLLAARAAAHDGPPYAVLVGQPCGARLIEVWTDPDIGTGRYWILLSAPEGTTLTPPDTVRIAIAPRDATTPETTWTAERLADKADLQYYVEPQFPAGGWWTTRILLRDGATESEARVDVEATPPGIGPWGFVIYLFPFVAFGLIFLKLALKRRRARRDAGGGQSGGT
jgi:hypothetical protein